LADQRPYTKTLSATEYYNALLGDQIVTNIGWPEAIYKTLSMTEYGNALLGDQIVANSNNENLPNKT
jgi:hypothetical protein